jgi:hypothetical protein
MKPVGQVNESLQIPPIARRSDAQPGQMTPRSLPIVAN